MTAEPLPRIEEPLPGWFYPPSPGGWTAEDLDHLPPEAPRLELIDGALILTSPQSLFHMSVVGRLWARLDAVAPDDVTVVREITVVLGKRQRPDPDITVLSTTSFDVSRTWYPAEDVLLAIEVVSDESVIRDRSTKPYLYAEAGIRYFWRIEQENSLPIVYTYELDPATGTYVPTGIHRDRLKIDAPFPVDINLTELVRRKSAGTGPGK
jgi:Uma2 family endonuclease